MPVPTAKYYIWVKYPENLNESPGVKLLARILTHYNTSPTGRTQKSFQLLLKSVFSSFNVNSKTVNVQILEQFYNKNGYPVSLADNVVEVDYKKWDGIQSITIFCEGPIPNRFQKIISFVRENGVRRIKFATV